jgi:hypothetical protein
MAGIDGALCDSETGEIPSRESGFDPIGDDFKDSLTFSEGNEICSSSAERNISQPKKQSTRSSTHPFQEKWLFWNTRNTLCQHSAPRKAENEAKYTLPSFFSSLINEAKYTFFNKIQKQQRI